MRTKILAASTLAASLMLAACGGGDSTSTPETLSGVAAVGVPIVGGQVSVACAGGSALSATTNSGGAWQVTISGQTLPCALEVSGGTVSGSANSTSYHSIALSFDTANITPLTDLVVANLVGKAPALWFSGINAAALNGANSAAVNAALQKVNTALGLSATLNGANPLTTRFSAVNGNLIDDILEAMAKARATAGLDYPALLALAAGNSFSAPTGFNFSSAYTAVKAAGGTGGSSSTCSATETAMTYSGATPPYTSGQKLCFTASPTSLMFSGKTLTNPTTNGAVSAPFAAYTFTDTGNMYEVVLNSGALFEINVLDSAKKYVGQFALPVDTGTGTGTGTTELQFTAGGIVGASISVGNMPVPGSESEFCSDILNNAAYKQMTASVVGGMTINSCSFSGRVGKVNATLTVAGLAIPYAMTFTYK